MAAPTEEHDVVPIFGLPAELLMEIFSYITFIPEKMDLERVSKRIQYISSRPQSWKGIHKLKMVIMCYQGDQYGYYASILLNGIDVPLAKWPAAIQLLFDRTHINELKFDIGSDVYELDPDALFLSIMQVFNQNVLKMKLKILKCYYWSDVNELCWISTRFLQISVPYLEKFILRYAYGMDELGTNSLAQIWPIINKCSSLNSFWFSCHGLSVDLTALIGKPLTELKVGNIRKVPGNNDLENLIEVINNAKGEGIQTLQLTGLDLIPHNNPTPFKYFSDHLNEISRKKLRDIRGFRVKADEISRLYLVPSIFPNLEIIDILLCDSAAIDIDKFCTMAVSFLSIAHSQSSNCAMRFDSLTAGGSAMQLQEKLQIACQNEGITVKFDNNDWSTTLLSKGNASIEIDEVHEFEQSDDEDDVNFE